MRIVEGIGCDCLGLCAASGARRRAGAEASGRTLPDSAEAGGEERAGRRAATWSRSTRPISCPVTCRCSLARGRAGKHSASRTGEGRMVHAHDGAAAAEASISVWRRRLAYALPPSRRSVPFIDTPKPGYPHQHAVLEAAGSAIGGIVGGPLARMVGQALGAVAGSAIDNRLLPAQSGAPCRGPRSRHVGACLSPRAPDFARLWPRADRGEIIWRTRFIERVSYRIELEQEQRRQGAVGAAAASTTGRRATPMRRTSPRPGEGRFLRAAGLVERRELDLTTLTMCVHGRRGQEGARSPHRREGRGRETRRPIAGRPMSCWRTSARLLRGPVCLNSRSRSRALYLASAP